MPTMKQLIRNTRQPIRNVTKSPALRGCPQRRGTCTRVYVRLVQIIDSDHRLRQKKGNNLFQYRRSVKIVNGVFPLCIKFMVSIGANPITSICNLR